MQLINRFDEIKQKLGGSYEPPMLRYYKAVSEQAMPHTTRVLRNESIDIIDRRRPSESEAIKDYRSDNRRQVTRVVFEDFLSGLTRLMKTGVVKVQNESELLKDYFSTNPLSEYGKNYGLIDYFFECIMKEALRNPNQLLVAFPYNPENPDIAPAASIENGGLPANTPVGIKTKIIPYDEVCIIDKDVLAFLGGYRVIKKGKDTTSAPFYFAADETFWYTLEPRYIRREGSTAAQPIKVKYELDYTYNIWYRHETGESLVNFLPGELEKTENGSFLESFLRPAFEIGDEVLGRFSDEQAINVKTAHPLTAAHPVDCTAKGCNNGWVDRKKKIPCATCNGTGKVPMPGPYEVYKLPKPSLTDPSAKSDIPVHFIHPGVEIGKNAFEGWQALMLMMKRAVGLDLIEGTANESGRAKEIRQEKLQDRLSRIAFALFSGTMNNYLTQVEALLQPTISLRQNAKIYYPQRFNLDGTNDLKEAAETALAEDRFSKKMAYYRDQYRSNPEQIRLKELAMCYAPLLLLTDEEKSDGLAKGFYNEDDFIRAQNAEIALYKVNKQEDIMSIEDDNRIFQLLDQYLIQRGLIVPKLEVDLLEEAQKSPLLETVGGVQGIVAISQAVAEGNMTEQAAERLLVEVFGFTEDVARSLIEAPVGSEAPNSGQLPNQPTPLV